MGLFTLCSCLKIKESYDRWIIRRVWGFRHQISKAKNLKMSVANIRKLQEDFTAMQDGYEISQHEGHYFAAKGWFHSRPLVISQLKANFAALRNLPSTWSDWLPMAVTLSFQLRIIYRLKHWIANFPSFKTTYSMHNWAPGSAPKVAESDCPLECFMADFSLLTLLAFRICLWRRTLKLQSFGSSCFWAFHCFAMDSKELSSIADCFGDQITNKNAKTYTKWLEMIAKVLNILIELKGNNYYSKVFKRVNYKLSNSTFWVVIKPS